MAMNRKNIYNLANRFSPRSVVKMVPMMLNFGTYMPSVMSAAMVMRNMDNQPRIHWNPNVPHPFYEEEEKQDILERLEWLYSEVMVDPEALISKMPEAIGLSLIHI